MIFEGKFLQILAMNLKMRSKIHNANNSKFQSIFTTICLVLLFICDVTIQEKVLDNKHKNNERLDSEYDGVETEFIDAEANTYETANYNFCPPPCSCLGDYFECKKVNLTKIPKLPEWIRSLELAGNKLDDGVENTIGNLSELISLNLKKNRLHGIPVFKGLIALQKLNLAHNKIQAINVEALLSLPSLRDLDLSRNIIKTILPHSFPTKNVLNSINLDYNRITILEDSVFDPLIKLTELYLSHNNLTSLPNGVFKSLQILKKLELSHNRLDLSWSTFKGLNDLKVLKLRSNGIRNLPDGVFHALKSIFVLELDSNRITNLNRQGFYNLTSLQTLSLANNSIDRIETDTWEFTQHLVSLDLSFNNLSEIRSQHLDCLSNLKILNFGHNKIQRISENTFDCAKALEQLDLRENKLSWTIEDTSGIFRSLKNLQKLDLSRNNVKSINQKAFSGLENLKILNLEFNNLTSMQFNAFDSLKKLEKLYLNSNHFLCDCNIQWLYSWLKMDQISKHVSIFCDYPIHLRGKALLELKEEDFECNESPKPRIIKEPTNQLAIKGTNLVLECSAISTLPSEMRIQWKRDNFDIHGSEIETKSLKLNSNSTAVSSFLHLHNVNHDYTGKYQCIVTNNFGTTYSQKFKITVATYPGFNKVPSNVTLNSGSTARLDCSAYGEPTPQIAWQKDGGNDFPAARERRMHVMPTDDAFFIINAKISDMGVYTCTAENPAGIIKANATLIVYEPPAFVKPMESKEVTQGTSTVLECMSSGSPKPTLNWYKDGKPLKLTERHFFAAESQLLIVVDAKLSDSGVYRCEMKNELGSVLGNLTLKVNKSMSSNVINVEEMTGIVVITVFCCAVGTSVIWVVIIYQTKKANGINANNFNQNQNNNNNINLSSGGPLLNQVTSSVSIDNYLQTATVAATANLNDDAMNHLIVESSGCGGGGNSQSSQLIIMNHLNNGNTNLRNDNQLRSTSLISNHIQTAPTSAACISEDSDQMQNTSVMMDGGDRLKNDNEINDEDANLSESSDNLPTQKTNSVNYFPPLSIKNSSSSNNDNNPRISPILCKNNRNDNNFSSNCSNNCNFSNDNPSSHLPNGSFNSDCCMPGNGDCDINQSTPLLMKKFNCNKECTDSINNLNSVDNSIHHFPPTTQTNHTDCVPMLPTESSNINSIDRSSSSTECHHPVNLTRTIS